MTDTVFEYMRNEIEKLLNSKTVETWTVIYESEHLDFQFLAKVEVNQAYEYGVRSASFSMLDLSDVTIPLFITNTVQLMLTHFNKTKERYENG